MTIRRRRSSGSARALRFPARAGAGGSWCRSRSRPAHCCVRPQPGRGEIAERLAKPGARFGEQDVVLLPRIARGKSVSRFPRIAALLRPCFRIEAEQAIEHRLGFLGSDRMLGAGGRAPSSCHSSIRSQTLSPVANVPMSSLGFALSSDRGPASPTASCCAQDRSRPPPFRAHEDRRPGRGGR